MTCVGASDVAAAGAGALVEHAGAPRGGSNAHAVTTPVSPAAVSLHPPRT